MTSPNRNSPSPSGLYLSLFHPVVPDRAQMRRYVKLAEEYQADGFEICGDAHGWRQGLDGVLLFEEYPRISRKRDRAEVLKLRRSLNEVVSLAHAAKKPVLYWHREVVLPQDLSSFLPELFDENGEIDYNKPEFFDLLRYKIDRFFQAVPAMDGIVLTLTEADFAVIHNSDPKRYPPEQVAAKIIATFAGEIQRRGKLFSLRTFGSIAADHAILTSAAQKAAEETRYEISAKITPYDWSLYAELNPQLTRLSNTSLAAEFDMLGEFFGLGEIPCLYPERIVQQVREARRAECVRVAPRCDRDERWIMDSVNGLNLFALCRTWRDDRITADEIWAEWANAHWGIAGKDLIPLMKKSEAMVKKSFYIDHHMVSQIATPDWEYMALGGIFAVFQENISLSLAKDLWSMVPGRTSPTRLAILAEKEEAVRIADNSYQQVQALREKIPKAQRDLVLNAWEKATWVTRMQLATARMVVAYFMDLEDGAEAPSRLYNTIAESRMLADRADQPRFATSLVADFAAAIRKNAEHFPQHYAAELRAKSEWRAVGPVHDAIVCGGFTDEYRVHRYMHASQLGLSQGYPFRTVGSRVFPDGLLEYQLTVVPSVANEVLIKYFDEQANLKITVGEQVVVVQATGSNRAVTRGIPVQPTQPKVTILIQKAGAQYPRVAGLASRHLPR